MIIVLKPSVSEKEIERILESINDFGYKAETVKGEARTIIGAVGNQKEKQRRTGPLHQHRGE